MDVRLEEDRSVERAPGARVDGELRSAARESRREHYLDHYRSWHFYARRLLWFPAAFLFGLFAYRIGPAVFRGTIATRPASCCARSHRLRRARVIPVAMIAAALTIVGIPRQCSLFLYIVALYTADLVVGAWLGRLIAPPADASLFAFGKSFAAGLAILTAVTLVPFLGPP